MVGSLFGVTDSKVMLPDRDVGAMIFMPENQINVDVVFVTTEATTEFCFNQVLVYEYENFSVSCNPAEVINMKNITTIDITVDQITTRNEMNDNSIYNFSTGDVAVNLGLRSASKTTSNNLTSTLVRQNLNSQREYRLDIGERVSQTYLI
jgi:hypothetical protein